MRSSVVSWTCRLAVAGSVLALLTARAPAARGDDVVPADAPSVSQAERRAAEAFTAYNRKEYAAAIALYLEAYDASPSGAILYNIARIYDLKLHNRPSAMAFYRRYVADPSAQADLVDISNQRLRELRNAEVATAAVVDEASSGANARDVGPRSERDGAALPRDPRDGWSTMRWTGVVMGVAGLAGVGVGSGFGLAAMSKASTAKDQCDGNACVSQQGVDAARTASRDATLSDIGFAAGGALLLTGAALYFLGGDRGAEEPRVHVEARTTAAATSFHLVARW